MRRISYQNRIALIYIVWTAIILGLVLTCIYVFVISRIDSYHDKLLTEVSDFYTSKTIIAGDVYIQDINKETPKTIKNAYIQIVDLDGNTIYKNENLGLNELYEYGKKIPKEGDLKEIDKVIVGYMQTPLVVEGKTIGSIFAGVDFNETYRVVYVLGDVMTYIIPIALLLLFLVTRIVVKRSIKPVQEIINTSNTITQGNLSTRIPLPGTKDELYELSYTINNLLDRIENAFEREKSFTSYASHEFRTPLATLKGTMEVLIRKPRREEEYKEKIGFCIAEVNRLNNLVDSLLLLSRYEDQYRSLSNKNLLFEDVLKSNIVSFSEEIKQKGLSVKTLFESGINIETDEFILSTLLGNLLSNAIKYSFRESVLEIQTYKTADKFVCIIQNQGETISKNELTHIFYKFYRAQTSEINNLNGFGLGLSIVEHFCDLLGFEIVVESKDNITQVFLYIPCHLIQ